MDNIKIGKTIKELRLNKGLSQGEVANICNITAPAVSKWERGESIPDISSLESLSNLFGVSINEIINSKAVINVTSSKNIILYRVVVAVLAVLVLTVSGLWFGYYKDVQATFMRLDDERRDDIKEEGFNQVLNDFMEQQEKPYHLYFEATEHKYVQGSINRWISDIFIQEPELYDYFIGTDHPSLNDINIDTTNLVRVNNETSTIRITWDRNNHDFHWDIDITYYDIESDDNYERMNGMDHITSNGNQYDFNVYDDGYFVLYELVEGNNIYDNYYFHISDMKPKVINDDIRIDYELNNLGIDVIFTDNYEETRYHFILNEYDGSYSSWFFQYFKHAYLCFNEGNKELIMRNFINEGYYDTFYLEAYEDEVLIWDGDFSIYNYLPREIDVEELEYIIRYQKQHTGLLHIEFERRVDGHIMSYELLPDELNNKSRQILPAFIILVNDN